MKHRPFLAAFILLLGAGACQAAFDEAYVYVDVDFKVLVPTDTTLAAFTPATLADANAAADAFINQANQQLDNSARGLRYRRIFDVNFVTAADVGDSDDPGSGNDIDDLVRLPGESNTAWGARNPLGKCFAYAPARPTQWQYRNDVCNFYILTGFPGGLGSLDQGDPTATNMLVQGGFDIDPGGHELGHWFTIPHTFLSVQSNTLVPIGNPIPWGDDGFDDTLKDWHQGAQTLNSLAEAGYNNASYASLSATDKQTVDGQFRLHYAKQFYNTTYTALTAGQKAVIDTYRNRDQSNDDSFARFGALQRDLIANGNFGSAGSPVFYADLSVANRGRVDDLICNIESYHFGKGSVEGYYSEKQFDRLCDVISQSTEGLDRSLVRGWDSGRYIFFGGPTTAAGNPLGSSKNPRATPGSAHSGATTGGHDILIGRPGTYGTGGGPLILNKAVTLRATKAGSFTIQ
jgi:hypothetical protein